MRRQYICSIKHQRILLLLLTCIVFTGFSVRAQQCSWTYWNINPAGQYPCSPTWITAHAELSWADPVISWGEIRWYDSETSTDILYSSPCYGDGATSDYSYYADYNKTIYVCVYDYSRGCETQREPFSIWYPPSPTGYIEYARDCGFGTTEIKAINTSSFGVGFELVKMNNWGNWDYVTGNYTGEFAEPGLNSNEYYGIRLNSGGYCGTSAVLPFSIDYSDPTTPTVTGNTTVCEARSTTLTANGPQNYFFWYDNAGNQISEYWQFQTPTNLAPGAYSYSVRGGNESGCRTNPASVTIYVNPKPVDGTISANATTICLGQSVTITRNGGVGTPHYWCSNNDGQSWNVFDNSFIGQNSFQHTPTALGTYRYHLRNENSCGFCWDQPGGCTTFPYVDVTVVAPPPVTVSVTNPAFGQGDITLTPSITGSSYQWQFNGADISGATSRTHTAGQTGNYSVRVTNSSGCFSISPQVYVTVNNNYNYIITNNIRKPGVTGNDQVGALSAADIDQDITYIDGVGRPFQEVATQGSPGNQDVVSFTEYDNVNRIVKSYLPYTGGSDGSYKTNAPGAQSAFYQNVKGDNLAYAETRFESSPANRVLEQGSPGASWQLGTGHTLKTNYRSNVYGEVRMWNYDPGSQTASGTSFYSDNELYVTEQTNEQGQKVVEYKNKSNLLICKKVQKIQGDDNSYLFTYYVYDDLGNLIYTIPPEGVNNLPAINYNFGYNDAFSKKWLYAYIYDERNRSTIKRTPGAGEEYTVYDSRDRVVFTQDANMRNRNQWLATLYDVLNRVVITGMVTSTATMADLQNSVNTQTADPAAPDPSIREEWTLNSLTSGTYQALNSITMVDGFVTADNSEFIAEIIPAADNPQITIIDGVAVNKNPLPAGAPFEILTVSYYDDYSWVAGTGTSLSSTIDATHINNGTYFITTTGAPAYAQPVAPNYHVRGMITGSKIKVLGTSSQYLYTVTFYDDEGRAIQVQSINQTGGKDIVTNQYDFSGKLLRTLQQCEKKGAPANNNIVLTKNEYNRNGGLIKVWKKTGNDPDHLIATHTYNELGELQSKVLGNGIETLDYAYNMRGWLKTINKDYLKAADNALPTRWFAMELGYDNTTSEVSNTSYNNPRFNGGISGTVWKTRGAGVKRKLDYTYDNLDRLVATGFKQQFGTAWANTDPDNQNFNIDFGEGGRGNGNSFIEYDDNGNIKSCWRKGLKVNASPLIDDLLYQYDGNQLSVVTDGQSDPNTKLGDFHDGTNTGNDYAYDDNGNLSKDENKKISSITYNYLDLPEVITFLKNDGTLKGTITYTYDATGNKLQKVVVDNSTVGKTITTTTKYLDGSTYTSRSTINPAPGDVPDYADLLQFIPHQEGRIRWIPAASGSGGSFVYDYFILDNVGSVRMILTEEQKTDAYPMASMEDVANKNDLNDPANYIPYYGNTDYTISSSVRYPISSINGYPATANANVTSPNAYVARLNGNAQKVGPSIVLKVMAGDQFNIQVSSWYTTNGANPGQTVSPLPDLVAALASGIGNMAGSKVSALDLQNSGFLSPNIAKFLSDKNVEMDRPKAFLNWVLLDDQFRYVASSSSFDQVKAESVYQNDVYWHRKSVTADKSGYLYVYVSNETPGIDVFFDNLQVTHIHGPLVEENHYYPMGMAMTGICSRALTGLNAQNKMKYQGQEYEDALGLDMLEFDARQYDPQLGRWHVPDPARQFKDISPYAGMANNWPRYTDPDGRVLPLLAVAAIVGVVTGAINVAMHWDDIMAGGSFNWGKAGAAFGIGFAGGFLGTLTGGAAASAIGVGGAVGGAWGGLVGSAVSSPITGIGNEAVFGDPYSVDQLGKDMAFGFVTGGIGGYVATKIQCPRCNPWTGTPPPGSLPESDLKPSQVKASQTEEPTIQTDKALGGADPAANSRNQSAVTSNTRPAPNPGTSQGSNANANSQYTKSNFRKNLIKKTGINPGNAAQAHHDIPQKYRDLMARFGINVDDPKFGRWWQVTTHQKNAYRFNEFWDSFLYEHPSPTRIQVYRFVIEMRRRFPSGITGY